MAKFQEINARVRSMLTEGWNVRLGNPPETWGEYLIDFESTTLHIRCVQLNPIRDEEEGAVIVEFMAPILFDVVLSKDLLKWVSMNDEMVFGHVAIQADDDGVTGTLTCKHTILGDFIDPDELEWSVATVGYSADRLDDELKGRFGGKRLSDL